MQHLKGSLSSRFSRWLVVGLCAAGLAANADSLSATFNSFMGTTYTSGSWGRLDLSLNADGTVGASLTANWPVLGFGLDSSTTLPVYNFSAGKTVNTWGWDDSIYGHFATGFSFWGPYPSTPLSWTMGLPGQFSSVRDLLDGNGAKVDFLLIMPIAGDGSGSFGAVAPVPEPAPWALALCGSALLARRFQSQRHAGAGTSRPRVPTAPSSTVSA